MSAHAQIAKYKCIAVQIGSIATRFYCISLQQIYFYHELYLTVENWGNLKAHCLVATELQNLKLVINNNWIN